MNKKWYFGSLAAALGGDVILALYTKALGGEIPGEFGTWTRLAGWMLFLPTFGMAAWLAMANAFKTIYPQQWKAAGICALAGLLVLVPIFTGRHIMVVVITLAICTWGWLIAYPKEKPVET